MNYNRIRELDIYELNETERLQRAAFLLSEAFGDGLTAQAILKEVIKVGYILNKCN